MRRCIVVKLSDGTEREYFDAEQDDWKDIARHTFSVVDGALVIFLMPPPRATENAPHLTATEIAAWAPGLWDSCHERLHERRG